MKFTYEFIPDEYCWYSDTCEKFGTDFCQTPCPKYDHIFHLLGSSGLPKLYYQVHAMKPASTEIDAYARLSRIQELMEEFVYGGYNLVIHGTTPGTGKTSWAAKLMQQYFWAIAADDMYTTAGVWVPIGQFLYRIKDAFTTPDPQVQQMKRDIYKAPLVVWDDLCTRDPSLFDLDVLMVFIDHRIANGLSNIFTTNVKPTLVKKLLGERMDSRLVNNAEWIELNGADRRRKRRVGMEDEVRNG